MKIAILSYYSGQVSRGVETFVDELANKMVSKADSVRVYQSGKPYPWAKYETVQIKASLPEFNYQSFKKISGDTDIILPTNGRIQSITAKIWRIKHKNSRLVISGQSGPGLDDRLNLYVFPDRFIPLTKFQKNWALKINPFVDTSVIPNGVDLQQFNPNTKPLDIDLPPPIILYVAAHEAIKRHHLLIEAVSHTPASLLLVGQGSLTGEIKNQCSIKLNHRFKIMNVLHHQIPAVYRACNLFVYPTSSYESFGISILEALASGLPVLATDDPIRREIVGDAGWFCRPEDTDSFSEILNRVLTETPNTSPRSQAEKFSWDKIAAAYLKLFTSLYVHV